MFYICAICMVKRSPLATLTACHRELLERVVAPAVDTSPLKDTILLLCGDCILLIKAMEAFQNTVLIGIKHLLNLHTLHDSGSSVNSCTPSSTPEIKLEAEENIVPEPELREQCMALSPIKTEPEDTLVTLEEHDPIKMAQSPIKIEPDDTLVKLEEQDPIKPDPQQPSLAESSLLRSRLLGLTSEVELKSEPASEPEEEPEEEPEYVRDSESTLTCDEDAYEDDWASLLHDHDYFTKGTMFLHCRPAGGGAGGEGGGAGGDGGGESVSLGNKVKQSCEVRYITEAEAVAELAEARASPAFAAAPFRCEHCALPFKSKVACYQHSILHSEISGQFVCPVCTQRKRTEAGLRTHVAWHLARHAGPGWRCRPPRSPPRGAEPSRPPADDARPPQPDDGACGDCLATYRDWVQFGTHYTSAHLPLHPSPARHDCYICPRSYTRLVTLWGHMKKHFEKYGKSEKKLKFHNGRRKSESKASSAQPLLRERKEKAKKRSTKKSRAAAARARAKRRAESVKTTE